MKSGWCLDPRLRGYDGCAYAGAYTYEVTAKVTRLGF